MRLGNVKNEVVSVIFDVSHAKNEVVSAKNDVMLCQIWRQECQNCHWRPQKWIPERQK